MKREREKSVERLVSQLDELIREAGNASEGRRPAHRRVAMIARQIVRDQFGNDPCAIRLINESLSRSWIIERAGRKGGAE